MRKNAERRSFSSVPLRVHTMLVIPFNSFFPSRFIFFPTTGYIVVTATAAAVIPTAIPAAKPHSFITVTSSRSFSMRIFSRGAPYDKRKNMEIGVEKWYNEYAKQHRRHIWKTQY